MRVADYVAQELAKVGVKHVFLVTGGGAMHLNDAFGRQESMQFIACHHEQSAAIAAESYFRMSQTVAAVNVTTGPGGVNALNGVYGAYVDSCAMIVISGQVKWETLVRSTNLPLRQLGDQEVDIIAMAKPVTKYAEIISELKDVRYQVEKALYLATSGRPGPVWLDIPMNIQGANFDPSLQKGFDPLIEFPEVTARNYLTGASLDQKVIALTERLKASERPVVMVGGGVRLSGAHSKFLSILDKLKVPIVTAWNAHDVLWNDHPLFAGRPGSVGDRAGNFTVQNSDFLLVLGSRLNIRQISYNYKAFARNAFKAMVDIDSAELAKPTLSIDLPIHTDLNLFLAAFENHLINESFGNRWQSWLAWCKARQVRYPVVLPEYWQTKEKVNPYCFVETLFNRLEENDLIVTGDGTACVATFQAANLKPGQRLYTNSGCASMGYDLPAAIGAYFSKKPKRMICITGDGSVQMNLQELQTVITHKIPLKLFILNNLGYHSIRQTQQNYFPDNIVGCGIDSGLSFPSFEKLAQVYNFTYNSAKNHNDLDSAIAKTINGDGFQVCEIFLDLNQQFAPKLASRKLPDGRMVSSPLEDLAPFLNRDELRENMIIPEWKEEL